MTEMKNPIVITDDNQELMNMDFENVLAVAEQAEKRIEAMNKIMNAALKITTGYDWVLIGGKPYLQESGATKVARMFGISWQICDGFPTQTITNGYPSFTYRMTFRLGNTEIVAEGSRSAADEFFAGKDDKKKSADAIDMGDVKKAAFTNCLNRGIKAILPGLRNLDVAALEAAGIRAGSGYTFKEGSKGGTKKTAEASGLVCECCGKAVTQKVASYSQGKFGRILCMDCQKAPAPASAQAAHDEDSMWPEDQM